MDLIRPPSVSRVLETDQARTLVERFGHAPTASGMRDAIARFREAGRAVSPEDVAAEAGLMLEERERSLLRPVWNCTGTILHTNLGRAILSEGAVAAAKAAMERPVALEYDLGAGARGSRDDAVADLLRELTGAEASLLVNNNAAAVMLVLATFAGQDEQRNEVVVSRGELIEIGGAFRLPDIMQATGARLREVGTTNRTHLHDYQSALSDRTALIIKVHPSNFRIEGFTSDVPAAQLAGLAREAGVPLVNDLGSGTLADIAPFGLPREPTVADAVAEGADIVTFSGDKLLGGPQAGFAIGRADLVERMKRHPMKRAMRLDKIRLAALEATLRDYRAGRDNPTWAAMRRAPSEIAEAGARLAPRLRHALGEGFAVEPVPSTCQVGSGAAPTATLPSTALAISPPPGRSAEALAAALRDRAEPVIGRIRDGRLLLDLRCLMPADEDAFVEACSSRPASEQ
jgi:L-seryl-tRNA(Ser) seleniumtransferase